MKPEWKAFLKDCGAEFLNDRDEVSHFGIPNRETQVCTTGTVMCDLSHLGMISVHGEDAQNFLHNQFSNDLNLVTETQGQLTSYSSAQGRVFSVMRIFRQSDTYFLSLAQDSVEFMLKRLRMFVMRSKVTLEDAAENFVRIGLAGKKAESLLASCLTQPPSEDYGVVQHQDFIIMRLPGSQPRYEILGQFDGMKKLWQSLDVDAAPVGSDCWQLLENMAGIPTLCAANQEHHVAQMINLELIGAINFKKGCYPGQETIAKMHYRGKSNRRMFLLHGEASSKPQAGQPLYACGAGEKGEVISSARHPSGGYAVLAVLPLASVKQDNICMDSQGQHKARILELPYPIELND